MANEVVKQIQIGEKVYDIEGIIPKVGDFITNSGIYLGEVTEEKVNVDYSIIVDPNKRLALRVSLYGNGLLNGANKEKAKDLLKNLGKEEKQIKNLFDTSYITAHQILPFYSYFPEFTKGNIFIKADDGISFYAPSQYPINIYDLAELYEIPILKTAILKLLKKCNSIYGYKPLLAYIGDNTTGTDNAFYTSDGDYHMGGSMSGKGYESSAYYVELYRY